MFQKFLFFCDSQWIVNVTILMFGNKMNIFMCKLEKAKIA